MGVPAAVGFWRISGGQEGCAVVTVLIGIDPHRGSHTAVAISLAGESLGQLRVRASAAQAGRPRRARR